MRVNFSDKLVGGFNYELIRGLSVMHAEAAEFGECMETMARIRDGSFPSWTKEWAKTASITEKYAEGQKARGDRTASRKAFMRACNYYRMAAFYLTGNDPLHHRYWEKSKDAFSSMIGLMDSPIEKISIPFEGVNLPGYFVPSGLENRPTLIAIGGFDSTKEEVYCWLGTVAKDYRYNCLIFEGPGQWGALMENPGLVFRPDYEKPVGAAVDWLMNREGLDNDKIAIIGYSMGGYLSVRGALDPRVKACIPNTLVVDCGASAKAGMKGMVKNEAFVDKIFGFLMKFNTPARWGFQHASWSLGISTPSEWVKAYEKFTLLGYEGPLKGKDMLFMFSEDDILDAAAPSPEIVTSILDYIASLETRNSARLFTKQEGASSHCQMGGLTYAHAAIFAWLEHIFYDQPIAVNGNPKMQEKFIKLFEKHGAKGSGQKAANLAKRLDFID